MIIATRRILVMNEVIKEVKKIKCFSIFYNLFNYNEILLYYFEFFTNHEVLKIIIPIWWKLH